MIAHKVSYFQKDQNFFETYVNCSLWSICLQKLAVLDFALKDIDQEWQIQNNTTKDQFGSEDSSFLCSRQADTK